MSRSILACTMVALLCAAGPSHAALGGDEASVSADRQALSGTLTTEKGAAYTEHQIHTPADVLVREYADSSGQVFAVTWRGPLLPDLRQLLGGYFPQYQQAAQDARAGHGRRAMLRVQQSDLVVQSGGHMRSFFGKAYVPGMVPPGVHIEDLR